MSNKNNKITKGWQSPIAIHPGEFLSDMLDEYGIKQVELAEKTGIHKKIINDIKMGKNPITRSTAIRLSKIFNVSSEYWSNLQNKYEDDLARIAEEKRTEVEVSKFIHIEEIKETYKEISKIKLVEEKIWIKKNYNEIILSLQKFFGSDSLDYIGKYAYAPLFRKYNRDRINRYSIAAWLRIGELKAIKTNVSEFDAIKLKNRLTRLKDISNKEWSDYIPEIESILGESGVVLVCAPKLKNTHIQGATQWISPNKVCIILKTSNQYEDRFWFNLFHEIGHIILKHSRKEIFVDMDNISGDKKDQQEKDADEFAQNELIPNFNERLKNYSNPIQAVDTISKEDKISKIIVAGRIAHTFKNDKKAWFFLNKYNKLNINYINI